jgi:ribose 5-phosphate isomerase B
MKIALACDHGGVDLKTAIAGYLAGRAVGFEDFGSVPGEVVDYPDYAAAACRAVLSGACDRAILICGTGIGMSMAANKFPGIRATVCWNPQTADLSRRHNNSNCLTLGGRILDVSVALEIVRIWLDTSFEGGRHERRLAKIAEIEKTYCGR